MVLILLTENGREIKFGIGDSVQSVVRAIRDNEVSTIVVGVVGKNGWEKQFQEVTVMPVEFGKR